MLPALERGIQGGKWLSLIDKVYTLADLRAGFQKVKSNHGAAGVDHETIGMFEQHLEENLEKRSQRLKDGSNRPQAVRRVWVDKPGRKENPCWGFPWFGIGWCKPHCET